MPATPTPLFIAITGTEGSGKDTYAHHLETKGFMHVSAGDFIRKQARAQGYKDPIPREVLSRIGDELKVKFGPSPITVSTLASYHHAREHFPAGLVISGFRRIGELEAFKAAGAVIIWIDADENIRYEREKARKRDDQALTLEAFQARGRKEYYGETEGGKEGVYLKGVEALADFKVFNNGDRAGFIKEVDQLLGLAGV